MNDEKVYVRSAFHLKVSEKYFLPQLLCHYSF